jgi:hypothetical protein
MSTTVEGRRANETPNYADNFTLKIHVILEAFGKKMFKKSSVISTTFSICT